MKTNQQMAVLTGITLILGTYVALAQTPQFTAVDLGFGTVPSALNNGGRIAGTFNPNGTQYGDGFVYDSHRGSITDLGNGISPRGINNSGKVIGEVYDPEIASWRAFVFIGGTLIKIPTLGGSPDGAGPLSEALGINSSGAVVGRSKLPANPDGSATVHAFLYRNGAVRDLGTLGLLPAVSSYSYAFGVNDLEEIVGASDLEAAVYDNGVWTSLGFYGAAVSINNTGQIGANKWLTDSSTGAVYDQAVIVDGGIITEISSLGGKECAAYKINNAGQVVGNSVLSDGLFPGHAFLYNNGTTYDLNSLLTGDIGTYLYAAVDINDAGAIVAIGFNGHGYLLAPVGQ